MFLWKGRKAGTKCGKCGSKYTLWLDSDSDQSLCPNCMEEEKDRKHRLNNSKWAEFEAKFHETD